MSAVPLIEGLTAQDFLDFAKANAHLLAYLPDERDWVHLDKHWICDVLYTLETEKVQAMIDAAMKKRKEKVEHSRSLCIEMRPEFVEALDNCLSFSCKHLSL